MIHNSQILKLAHMSKEADKIVKGMREWESKTMNNEVSKNGLINDYDLWQDNEQ